MDKILYIGCFENVSKIFFMKDVGLGNQVNVIAYSSYNQQ